MIEKEKFHSKVSAEIDVDEMETALLLVTPDYNVKTMNRAAQRLFSVGDNKRRNNSLSGILLYPEGLMRVIDRSSQLRSIIVERELEMRFDASRLKILECVVTPIVGPQKQCSSFLVEITDRELFQQIKKESDLSHQSDIWEAIARELGHEIKNPLTGIRGAAQLLREELGTNRYDDFIDRIVGESDRLTKLVDRMLGSSLKPASIQKVNVHEVLDHVHFLVVSEDSNNVVISKSYQPPIYVDADRDQLVQVFLNLLRNAAQAVEENGGNIVVSTRIGLKTAVGDKIYAKVAEIRFIDTGRGVNPRFGTSIFLPLVSDKQEGSGLGLPIAQKLVRANRGLITLERSVKRTEFLVKIPLGEEIEKK